MTRATVRIYRDPESPDSFIAEVIDGPATGYVTQGETIAEAQYMAADLLKTMDAPEDTVIDFSITETQPMTTLLIAGV
jgi:hypothetical protein